ncbi:hypothetical protein B0H10DRAFT_1970448 [Mycena sp. CBHHK59/15]|nr:hypothetical protein B0H10DRAFT_1970448 [Mycena sp. CBHHK59/15]
MPLLSEPTMPSSSAEIEEWGSPPPSEPRKASRGGPGDRTVWLILLACLISIATLIFNIARLAHSDDIEPQVKLDYPNPYVGLENAILKHPVTPAPILNFPLLLAQINTSDPGRNMWTFTIGHQDSE